MVWLFLLIPIIVAGIAKVMFDNVLDAKKLAIPFVVGIIVIFVGKGCAEYFATKDIEYLGGYLVVSSYYEAWNGKADALNRAHRVNDALTASDQVIALNPNYAKGWINRGYILYNLGRYNEELLAYERAIEIDPTNTEAWFNKGYSLGGMGKWDEALKVFDRVQALDPAYPNLAANQQIARQNLDAATPFYIKNAPVIAVFAIIIIGAILWLRAVKKKN